jgi:DNA-binding winged helix-turn-helix (wHTH) protein
MVKLLNDNFIAHKKKIYRADDSKYLLLKYFFIEATHFLSKEDIRQDVLFDDDASEGAIRTLIYDTRKWLKQNDIPLEIITIIRKGYRLIKRNSLKRKKS